MSNDEVRVRAEVFKGDNVVAVERSFPDQDAANRWLDDQDDKGKLNQVLAWGR